MNLFINRCPLGFNSKFLVVIRHVKKENASHPVNIRHSKTSLVNLLREKSAALYFVYKLHLS